VKKLPTAIQCPSVGAGSLSLSHEACDGSACAWWEDGCGARVLTENQYSAFLDKKPLAPDCPIASMCRWHVEAVASGLQACLVRRLGMLCEHQGGEWNTFEMAAPEEWEAYDE